MCGKPAVIKRRIRYYRIYYLRHDLPASLSVFLVALPLCLGISLASNAPVYMGIISGIIGGIVVGLVSKSALSVSGPAAGLTAIVSTTILAYGDISMFLSAVIVAGIFQVLMGILRLGSIANYFPSAVIKGMLAAIGIMLMLKQVPVALGYDKPDFWNSGIWNIFNLDNFSGGFRELNQHTSRGAILITLISLLVLVFLQSSGRKLKFLPSALIVVIIGTVVNLGFSQAATAFSLKQTQLVNIPGQLFNEVQFPNLEALFSNTRILKDGLIIGILASLESLLCVEAIDKLDNHNRVTPVNRELIAQGVGNISCGFLGGLPLTAVIVRGSANVDAGGRTKLSAILHGFWLLLAVLAVPFLLSKIPYAALAAILLLTGFNLTRPRLYRHMWSLGPKQFMPFILTVIIILFTDLLIGVAAGLVISIYYIIRNNFKAEYRIEKTMDNETEVYYIRLNTNVTFLNKVKLKEALDKIPEYSRLTIDGSTSNFIDYDILEIISEFENKARDREIEVHLKGIQRVNITAIH